MDEQESRRVARELYAKMPDDLKDPLRQLVELTCREAGKGATPEFVEAQMIGVLRLFVVNNAALFNEITEEERHRIIDEEYKRLRTDPDRDVEDTVLLSAVQKRFRDEYGGLLAPRRPRPFS